MNMADYEQLLDLSDFLKKYYPEEHGRGNDVEVAIRLLKNRRPKPAQAIIEQVKEKVANCIDGIKNYSPLGDSGLNNLKEDILRIIDLMSFNLPAPLYEKELNKDSRTRILEAIETLQKEGIDTLDLKLPQEVYYDSDLSQYYCETDTIEEAAKKVAKIHKIKDSGTEAVYLYSHQTIIKLLEVSKSVGTTGDIFPILFKPYKKLTYHSEIILASEEEWEMIKDGKIQLPNDWKGEPKRLL